MISVSRLRAHSILTLSSLILRLSSSSTTSRVDEDDLMWFKIEENYYVFAEQFYLSLPSKTISCEKNPVCFKWCKIMLQCIVRD